MIGTTRRPSPAKFNHQDSFYLNLACELMGAQKNLLPGGGEGLRSLHLEFLHFDPVDPGSAIPALEFLHLSPLSKGDAALFAAGGRRHPLLISPLFASQGGERIASVGQPGKADPSRGR